MSQPAPVPNWESIATPGACPRPPSRSLISYSDKDTKSCRSVVTADLLPLRDLPSPVPTIATNTTAGLAMRSFVRVPETKRWADVGVRSGWNQRDRGRTALMWSE